MHNPGSNGRKYAQPWIPGPAVCTTLDPWGPGWNPIELSTSRRFAAAIPCGPVGIPSSDQRRPGQQLRSPRKGTRCTTLDPMAGSMHNPGSNGRKYAQPRIQGQQYADVCIHLENVCKPRPAAAIPCGPGLDAVPPMDPWASSCERRQIDQRRAGWQLRSMGTWLEFDQVINSGPGQQLRSPREGTRCTTLDPMAGSMHNPGSQGQQYAQPWIQGQQYADVCIHLENVCKQRPAVCKRLHTFGERLQTKASSMQTSAYIWRTSANQGQQYANVCKHSENVCKPRPAAAIPCGPVGSCDPWGLGWSSIE
jgi:hypothetical protein